MPTCGLGIELAIELGNSDTRRTFVGSIVHLLTTLSWLIRIVEYVQVFLVMLVFQLAWYPCIITWLEVQWIAQLLIFDGKECSAALVHDFGAALLMLIPTCISLAIRVVVA